MKSLRRDTKASQCNLRQFVASCDSWPQMSAKVCPKGFVIDKAGNQHKLAAAGRQQAASSLVAHDVYASSVSTCILSMHCSAKYALYSQYNMELRHPVWLLYIFGQSRRVQGGRGSHNCIPSCHYIILNTFHMELRVAAHRPCLAFTFVLPIYS